MPAADRFDLSVPRRIHVVGAGGVGMSAIATVLSAMGHQVSGSDLKSSPGLERLRDLGVEVAVGHRAENVGDAEVVTLSTAVPAANPEIVAAVAAGIPVLRRAGMLAAVTATRRGIGVAGTHGKTTTSSMLALVLEEAGLRPSFLIGGQVNDVGSGAVWGEGEWLVVEADESDGTFLELPVEAVVVTSVEPDHLAHYGGGFDGVVAAFGRYLAAAPGAKVVCADDPVAAGLAASTGALTYGTAEGADYRMTDLAGGRASVAFTVEHGGAALGRVALPVPGLYNARNACAALVTGLQVGAPFAAAAAALARYGGVARRFQFRGEQDGVTFVDDYAHLPGEVRAVLAATRDGGWDRVVAVFQPHRYSRTAEVAADFAGAFADADLVVLTDVYGAGEAPRPGVTGRLVLDAVLAADPATAAVYLPGRPDLAPYLRRTLRRGDLCITLGAGDITLLADEYLRPAAPAPPGPD